MRKILVTLILTLTLTLTGSYFYHDSVIKKTQKTISNLQQDQKLKLAEIAKLEDVLKSEIEKNNQYQKTIDENLKIINQLKKEIDNLNNELNRYNNLRQLDIVATAYTAFCNTGCIGITSNGTNVKNTIYKDGYRVVAVDPKVIPMGSLLYIESKNENFVAVADDTGGDIKGRRVDILVKNKSIAYDFGRQDIKVTVLREGKG